MPSPFPGMDPYLEDPSLWPALHRLLAAVLFEILAGGMQGRYQVVLGTRRYTTVGPGGDVEHQENYVEIRQRSDDTLVTLLDIVSPANKVTAAGRQAYLEQRSAARACKANLVEIDLVSQGQPMLDYSRDGLPEWDHAVTVTRASHADRYEIYTATWQKKLPKFRLPLAADDRDTVLDLQIAFTKSYQQGDFSGRIDYRKDPVVPLDEEERRWLETLLIRLNLRKALPPHTDIALAAYRIWEQEGRPSGREKEHWYQALAALQAERVD
jgi:hypothetical protein